MGGHNCKLHVYYDNNYLAHCMYKNVYSTVQVAIFRSPLCIAIGHHTANNSCVVVVVAERKQSKSFNEMPTCV